MQGPKHSSESKEDLPCSVSAHVTRICIFVSSIAKQGIRRVGPQLLEKTISAGAPVIPPRSPCTVMGQCWTSDKKDVNSRKQSPTFRVEQNFADLVMGVGWKFFNHSCNSLQRSREFVSWTDLFNTFGSDSGLENAKRLRTESWFLLVWTD